MNESKLRIDLPPWWFAPSTHYKMQASKAIGYWSRNDRLNKPGCRTLRGKARRWLVSSSRPEAQPSRGTFPTKDSRSDAIHKINRRAKSKRADTA